MLFYTLFSDTMLRGRITRKREKDKKAAQTLTHSLVLGKELRPQTYSSVWNAGCGICSSRCYSTHDPNL